MSVPQGKGLTLMGMPSSSTPLIYCTKPDCALLSLPLSSWVPAATDRCKAFKFPLFFSSQCQSVLLPGTSGCLALGAADTVLHSQPMDPEGFGYSIRMSLCLPWALTIIWTQVRRAILQVLSIVGVLLVWPLWQLWALVIYLRHIQKSNESRQHNKFLFYWYCLSTLMTGAVLM